MAVIDAKQQEILSKFRTATVDCILPDQRDSYLLQWLQARDFDLKKAELMLRKSLQWRETFGTDLLTDDWKAPEVYTKFYPGGLSGYGKEQNPVWIIPVGRVDMQGLFRCVKKEEYIKYTVWILERSLRLMCKRSVNQHVFIFDMEGFSLRKFTWAPAMEVLLQLVKINEANYPETLKKCIVVNAPKYFSVAYGMLKPFIHERTAQKVIVFDSNRDAWISAVLDVIDPDQLPVHWGGTRTDPEDGNPYCSSQICMAGEIPKEYFEKHQINSTNCENFTASTLPAGEKKQFEYSIAQEGAVLKWEYKSDGGDVGFAVFRKDVNSNNMQIIIPKERVESHVYLEEGEVVCNEPGTYVLEFDNSFSMLKSKKLLYNILVLDPPEEFTVL